MTTTRHSYGIVRQLVIGHRGCKLSKIQVVVQYLSRIVQDFADFITNDTTISKVINDNFEYIHVNYNPRKSGGEEKEKQAAALMKRLDNCGRFGFPVFVVLDDAGKIIHIQDSSFLEEGQGYNQEKVLRFFKNWTPQAIKNS